MSQAKKSFKDRYPIKSIWVFTSIIFVVVLGISLFYIQYIKTLTKQNVYQNITELSEQTTTQLKQSITGQEKFVSMMIDAIDLGYVHTVSQLFNRFEGDLDSYHFTRLVVLDKEGNGITSDGHQVANYPNIEEFFRSDEVYLSENRPSTVTDDQVNIYAKTFELEGQKMVLFATIQTNDYKEILLRRLFHGEGRTYLINQEGMVLIDSSEEKESYNLFTSFQERTKEKDKIENMKQEMAKGKVGTFDFTLDNELQFLHYEKVGVNDWYVVTIAKEDTIAKELNQFIRLSTGTSLLINFLIMATFIAIYYWNQKKNKKIYETAYIDPVTSLGNEIYFKENVSPLLLENQKNAYIIVLDINKFKVFNQLYDYEFCNLLLKELGRMIEDNLPENSIACRLSRDIYAMYFCYHGQINSLASKILKKAEKLVVKEEKLHITLSMGIYQIEAQDRDINKVLDKAYMAHSHVKSMYQEGFFVFDQNLEHQLMEEQQIESRMEDGLLKGEFEVYYQPKISTKTEELCGAEALVRWNQSGKVIPPNQFIPLFERNKFIIKLDLYVFEKVCQDLKEWKEEGLPIPIVSVNVSKEHFIDEKFIDAYVEIANKYQVDPEKIELEMTESATVGEDVPVLKIMRQIKKCGFLISIDDFGTGYSSLGLLQDMPIDVIKIDKRFVDSAVLTGDNNVINYIVFIAKKRKFKTIAEGVEAKEQVEYIKNLGCDMIQGYYYSKPLPKNQFEEYMKNATKK